MAAPDSALDPERLAAVRALLRPQPARPARVWPALAAAAFAAFSAMVLAASMVISPPRSAEPAPVYDELR